MTVVQPAAPRSRARFRLLTVSAALVAGIPAGFVLAHAIRVPVVQKSLQNYQPAIITQVYDRNGVPFASYAIQKRIVVTKREMSPWLIDGIIATEDADFYHHGGFNPKAIVRAALKDIIAGKKVEGASTLTQQLARGLFLTPAKEEAPKVGAYFAEEIRQHIENKPELGAETLYQRGLKVYSTLDLAMQQAAETALQRGLRRWDRRRGFRRPSRNLVAEGVDPSAYKDPSWSNEPYAPDKLYTAVVMNVERGRVTTRVGKDSIALVPAAFKWTEKTT